MGVGRRQLKKFVVAEQKSKKIFPPGEFRADVRETGRRVLMWISFLRSGGRIFVDEALPVIRHTRRRYRYVSVPQIDSVI